MLDRTKTFRTVNHVLVSFSFSNFSGFHFSYANLVPLFITCFCGVFIGSKHCTSLVIGQKI